MRALKRRIYYLQLACLDLLRLRGAVALHVIIVAGICLPILILLGLKRGHIAELRHDLITSPTGRQIIVSVGGRGEMLTPTNLPELKKKLGPVDVIVPDTERLGDLERLSDPEVKKDSGAVLQSVTFRSTAPGDPILSQHGADLLQVNEKAVVLFDSVAAAMGVQAGDSVRLTISRRAGSSTESATVDLEVRKVIAGNSDDKIGYLEIGILNAIEHYVRGGRVDDFGWPAVEHSVRDRYAEYLLFCEVSRPLSDDDIDAIHTRGYYVEEVLDASLCSLYGILKPESLDKLVLYRLYSEHSRSDPNQRLFLTPRDVADITAEDDVVLPWNPPRTITIGEVAHRLLGFSLPRRTWLKSYMHDSETVFPYSVAGNPVMFGADGGHEPGSNVILHFDTDHVLDLETTGSASIPNESNQQGPLLASQKPPVAIVPVQLLARLDAYHHGLAEFDESTKLFIPLPSEPTYTQVRVYATTIDSVLGVIEQLETLNYAYRAQNARIKEIQGQDRQLEDLVTIVAVSVFFFGVITVISVLLEATERKRATIGIMRVMGVSRTGIFAIVFVRAIVVGLMAGLVAWSCGEAITYALNWEPTGGGAISQLLLRLRPDVKAIIDGNDIVLVLAGSTLCCILGAICPAWRASRLDPFDAITEGRFR